MDAGMPDCSADSYDGRIFYPQESELHYPGERMNVSWYLQRGSPLEDNYDSFSFSVFLQSFELATNITLIDSKSYNFEDVGDTVIGFTQCTDHQIKEVAIIPFDLEIIEVLFNVVVVLDSGGQIGAWTDGHSQTGSTFTISPTNFLVSSTMTTATATTSSSSSSSATATSTVIGTDQPAETSPPSSTTTGTGAPELPRGAKIGISLGVVFGLLLLLVVTWLFWRMRRQLKQAQALNGTAAATIYEGKSPPNQDGQYAKAELESNQYYHEMGDGAAFGGGGLYQQEPMSPHSLVAVAEADERAGNHYDIDPQSHLSVVPAELSSENKSVSGPEWDGNVGGHDRILPPLADRAQEYH